jgi:putative transport protein
MLDFLAENPLVLLFLVAASGYLLGRIRIGGFSLGISAVLFAGMGFGALDPRLALPEFVWLFGLAVFIYAIGLANGPAFFASFGRRGLRDNLLVLALLLGAFLLTVAAGRLVGLSPAGAAGVFSGATGNTAALAAILDLVGITPGTAGGRAAAPVVAYSLTYPLSILVPLLVLHGMQRRFRVDWEAESAQLRELGAGGQHLRVETVRVTKAEAIGAPIEEVMRRRGWHHVLFGRLKRGRQLRVASNRDTLQDNDLVTVIGEDEEVTRVVDTLGVRAQERLELDRRRLDFRRVFVSNPQLAGKRVGDLDLVREHGALITRVRRGDVDLLAEPDTVLELGDRVRILAPRERIDEVSRVFGDSYRSLAEFDLATFGFGIALGILVGMIPIPVPVPGAPPFTLGIAGGPLLVGLILGRLGRTGPFFWHLPFSANVTLRQLGLTLFLAGIGVGSGFAFVETIRGGRFLGIVAAGVGIAGTVSVATLWIGYRFLRIPMPLLAGILAGLQTQLVVAAVAEERTKNDIPSVGYAEVYPLATVAKILLAQAVLVF